MPTAPTRVTGVNTASFITTGDTKVSPSFTCATGDLLTLITTSEAASDATATTTPTVSAGAVTWTRQQLQNTATNDGLTLWTGDVTTGATMTVSVTGSAGNNWGFSVEVWRNHGGVGASTKGTGTGAPLLNLTTTADNSAIHYGSGDYNATAITSRTWRSINGTPMAEQCAFRAAASHAAYAGYALDAGTAGVEGTGLSAPTGQAWAAVAVEILAVSGTAYTASPADTAALTDAATDQMDIARTAADTAALADSAAAQVSTARTAADTAALTDSAAASLGRTASAADTAALTDSATDQMGMSRAPADTAALTDSVSTVRTTGRTVADTAGLTDAAAVAVDAVRAAADTAGLTDAATAAQALDRAPADSIALTDAASGSVTSSGMASADDTAALADTATATQSTARTVTDTAALTDSPTATQAVARSAADTATLVDASTATQANSRTGADTAALTDAATATQAKVLSVADTAALTDAVTASLGHGVADTVALTDSVVIERVTHDRDISLAAIPLPTRWAAVELLPRWTAAAIADTRFDVVPYVPTMITTELPTRWATALNPGETMSVDIIVTAGAVKYVGGTITEITGKDISTDTFVMSLGSDKNPGTTWVAPDATVAGATTNIVTLKLLVSDSLPAGIVVPGTYWVWAKVTDAPEVEPMRLQGPITVR